MQERGDKSHLALRDMTKRSNVCERVNDDKTLEYWYAVKKAG